VRDTSEASLRSRLREDLRDALRERDARRKAVIRMALTGVANAEVEKGGNLSEDEIAGVLQKQARQRKDTIEELEQSDRPELLESEVAELAILETYLPELLSAEQIEDLTRSVIAELSADGMEQFGQVMSHIMSQLQGRADGRLVNEVVRRLLSGS
jgi:uncharacterized protein YqeY